jgi:hypothetical protein
MGEPTRTSVVQESPPPLDPERIAAIDRLVEFERAQRAAAGEAGRFNAELFREKLINGRRA